MSVLMYSQCLTSAQVKTRYSTADIINTFPLNKYVGGFAHSQENRKRRLKCTKPFCASRLIVVLWGRGNLLSASLPAVKTDCKYLAAPNRTEWSTQLPQNHIRPPGTCACRKQKRKKVTPSSQMDHQGLGACGGCVLEGLLWLSAACVNIAVSPLRS